MGAAASTTLGVFGYLPGQPDFVRVRATGREVRHLEDWLESGLHQSRWEMGGGFPSAYPQLFHRFVFRPDNSTRTVIGVVCASVDCHQRPFPFVVFDFLPTPLWDEDPAALIGQNSSFFASLEDLVRQAGRLSHIGQIHGQVASMPSPVFGLDTPIGNAEFIASEESRYQNFLQETVCGELGGSAVQSGTALCLELMSLLGHGPDPRLLAHGLAIPLCRPPFARELELRFYLSFVLTLLAAHHVTLTLFWQLGGQVSGSLLVYFREPRFDSFSALLNPGGASRSVIRPGAACPPLLRPYPGLTDATCLHTLLRLVAAAPQQLDGKLSSGNGKST